MVGAADAYQEMLRKIDDYVLRRIAASAVNDRADIVRALEEAEFDVPVRGRGCVTVLDRTSGRQWRLEGLAYGRGFRLVALGVATRRSAQ